MFRPEFPVFYRFLAGFKFVSIRPTLNEYWINTLNKGPTESVVRTVAATVLDIYPKLFKRELWVEVRLKKFKPDISLRQIMSKGRFHCIIVPFSKQNCSLKSWLFLNFPLLKFYIRFCSCFWLDDWKQSWNSEIFEPKMHDFFMIFVNFLELSRF